MVRVAVLILALAVAGCGHGGDRPAAPTALPRPSDQPWVMPSAWSPPASASSASSRTASSTRLPSPARPSASRSSPLSTGWEITVYYTAVERFHAGEPEQVTGCLRLDCTDGGDDLGTYPADFVDAVRNEGTGRTRDGRYLNWSDDVGFWLDSAPRDSGGRELRPFASAAADPGVLPRNSTFQIVGCGRLDDGSRAQAHVCAALKRATWTVTDEFTPGLGGDRHIDAYIGAETGPGFTDSAWYVSLTGATLRLR
jgi:hypothetical protein